jgi:hypothetical protein
VVVWKLPNLKVVAMLGFILIFIVASSKKPMVRCKVRLHKLRVNFHKHHELLPKFDIDNDVNLLYVG